MSWLKPTTEELIAAYERQIKRHELDIEEIRAAIRRMQRQETIT